YDNGNYLSSNLSTSTTLAYSDGILTSNPTILGTGSRYFTRKYDGLFVLAADLNGVSTFKISGNLGADGSGSVDGSSLALTHRGVAWRGLVKRVFGAPGTPSVDHLVILKDSPSLTHTFSTNSDSDNHDITGLAGTDRLYYLLYSSSNGGYIGNAETTAIIRRFLDSIGGNTPWMTATPPAGSTPAGNSSQVAIQADARRLYAGTYQTTLTASHNDPARPTLTIPTTLTVTGTPKILLDSPYFIFPSTIVGSSRTLDLIIHNSGTDTLTISEVRLNNLFSTAQAFPLHLPPGGTAAIPVTYTPFLYGLESGLAQIISNAANTPTAFVSLYGLGVPPPGAQIDSSQIQVSMGAATSREESRLIANTGQTNLQWNVGIDYGQANPLANQLDLSGLTVRIISDSNYSKFNTLVAELTRLGADAAEVYYSNFKPSLLATTDLLLIDYSLNYIPNTDLQAINTWVFNGGGLMATAPSSSITDFNALTLGSGLVIANTGSISQSLITDIRYDITTVGVTSLNAGSSSIYTKMLVSGTAKPLAALGNGQLYAGIGTLGSGRIVGACGDIAASQSTGGGNLRFLTNSLAWLAGRVRNWVEPVPASGITGSGTHSPLSFVFDTTGLVPGTYFADAVVKTNDPARAEIRIPLSLQVTNSAQISANVTAVDFDPTVVGSTSARSLLIENTGHSPLTLSSATGDAGFNVTTSFPIVLDPGKSATVQVNFAPPSVGLHSGSLILNSNALTHPALAIPVSGFGLAAPVLAVSSQLNFAIATNTSQILTFPIGNTGSGHLNWRITDSFATGKPLTYPPSLKGVNVGFLSQTYNYSSIRTKLTGYGCSIVNVAAPIQQATLDSIHILLVDDSFSSTLTASDYSRIRNWVEAGGSLMLTAESLTLLQPLLNGTGISPSNSYRSSSSLATPSPHPVTTGITAVYPYYSEAHFTLSGDAVPLLSFDAASAYAAAARLSRGHIIAIGNEAFQDSDFSTGDGERFAVQSLTWLSNRLPWLGHAPDTGSLPPGGSDTVTLSLNSTKLATGTYRGTLVLESNDPARTSLQLSLTLTVTTTANAARFAQWQYDHLAGPADPSSGFAGDWNRDGLANGIEFYFAIDPSDPHNHKRHHLPAIAHETGAIIYRYTRLTSQPDSLLRIRHSTNLSTWTALSAAAVPHTTTTRVNGDGTTTVQLRFPTAPDCGFFSFILDSP
ncbi:MAG: choice-of-anchor D domain-containing protein, partial [Luteolibacter sp.]